MSVMSCGKDTPLKNIVSGSRRTHHRRLSKHCLPCTFDNYHFLTHFDCATTTEDRIRFPLGTVVKHTKYGFRGVVVAWDPFPKADVSNWDGLKDIEGDVNAMPFYHVIPDLNDTVEAFGAERPFRYVCQENLVLCPEHEQDIEVSLSEGWSASEGSYEF